MSVRRAVFTRSGLWVVVAILASGCVNQPRSLYYWGSYQPQVYEYLKGDGTGHPEQIAALERDIEKARSANQPLPPGYQAHLGLLYAQSGNLDRMAEYFAAEKAQFPESGPFMDFLLKNATNKAATP